MTVLTPSQNKAIEKQIKIMRLVYPDATFRIWQPNNMNIIRLVCEYETPNLLGEKIKMSQAWTVGKRGKLSEI